MYRLKAIVRENRYATFFHHFGQLPSLPSRRCKHFTRTPQVSRDCAPTESLSYAIPPATRQISPFRNVFISTDDQSSFILGTYSQLSIFHGQTRYLVGTGLLSSGYRLSHRTRHSLRKDPSDARRGNRSPREATITLSLYHVATSPPHYVTTDRHSRGHLAISPRNLLYGQDGETASGSFEALDKISLPRVTATSPSPVPYS